MEYGGGRLLGGALDTTMGVEFLGLLLLDLQLFTILFVRASEHPDEILES